MTINPPKPKASDELRRRLADAGFQDNSTEQERAYETSKKKLTDHLWRNPAFKILTKQSKEGRMQEFTAESLAESLLQFFRFDAQPRYLKNEKNRLLEEKHLSKNLTFLADIRGLPGRVRKIAGDIGKANSSKVLNLFVEMGHHAAALNHEQRPDEMTQRMPGRLRELPSLLNEYAAFLEGTIKREVGRLTRFAEEWREQADEVIWNLVEGARRQTGRKMFREIAQLLTDGAATLDGDKIFSDKEVAKRYYRHRKNSPQK
jgi:hypothetical protein